MLGTSNSRSDWPRCRGWKARLTCCSKNAGRHHDPYADLPPTVIEALRKKEKIQAIKHYRQATGAGLKEAKAFIEETLLGGRCAGG